MISLAYVKYQTVISVAELKHLQQHKKYTWCIINKF